MPGTLRPAEPLRLYFLSSATLPMLFACCMLSGLDTARIRKGAEWEWGSKRRLGV